MPNWHPIKAPLIQTGVLADVSAISASNVWAVGGHAGARGSTVLEHWNGRRWAVTGPSFTGFLNGVSGTSRRDVWAVGATGPTEPGPPLILHFDGSRWAKIKIAFPDESVGSLTDVVALAPDDAWAVGQLSLPFPDPAYRGLAAHWDGDAWSVELIGTSALLAVAAASNTDVWAVGPVETPDEPPYVLPTVEHWDGHGWTSVDPGFTDELYGVTALSSRNVWVVGAKYGTAIHQVVGHWNGERWTRRMLGAADWLSDVDGTAPNDVWAVGFKDIVHWNGSQWKTKPLSAELGGVAAISRRNVWAVGSGGRGALILHYACR